MSQKIASRSQVLQLAGMLAQNMPVDLRPDIIQEWIDDPQVLKQFLTRLRESAYPIDQIETREFEVTIYPQRPPYEWIRVGKYDHLERNFEFYFENPNRTLEHLFTVNGKEPYQAKVVLFKPGFWAKTGGIERCAPSDKIIKYVRPALNLKPIGLEHIMAFGEQHPEVQREWCHHSVNLDSIWTGPDDIRYVFDLASHTNGRQLGLKRIDYKWFVSTWFFGLKE